VAARRGRQRLPEGEAHGPDAPARGAEAPFEEEGDPSPPPLGAFWAWVCERVNPANVFGRRALKCPRGGPFLASRWRIIIYWPGRDVLSCLPRPASMLKLLRINNIAIIAEVELEFGSGLSLLTGETGAGKSILID